MNSLAILFLVCNAVAVLTLSRRWALLPLLVSATYMTAGQLIMLGPFHFTVLRMMLLLGLIRMLARRERLLGGFKGLDWVLLIWGAWLLCSSAFHESAYDALVFRLGVVYTTLGIYFLIRVFCQSTEELIQVIAIISFLLVPVALEMTNEILTGQNFFAQFGGVFDEVQMRDGKLRAQGPFSHAILGGTVGAVCMPLMIGIWRRHRVVAAIGLSACAIMVLTSNSSGPIMSVVAGVFALGLWRWRHLTRQMRVTGMIGYVLADLVMKDPAYFLIARIDLTGSSTGWHRAELIRSAFQRLGEWWWAGTDYTRHWMPYGVSSSPNHSDITNHYLYYGVWGGLPLMFLFIGLLWVAFRYVGLSLRLRAETSLNEQFLIWSLGAGLFCHAVTCISISYWDQSVTFLYLNIAAIGSLYASASVGGKTGTAPASHSRNPGDHLSEPASVFRQTVIVTCPVLPRTGLQPIGL